MIGLEHQHIAAAQMIAYTRWHVAKIGGKADLYAFRAECEPHRIDRVMRNGEGPHFDVADLETVPGRKKLDAIGVWRLPGAVSHTAHPRVMRRPGHEHRHVQFAGYYQEAVNMIRVFVCNHHRTERLRIGTLRFQPLESFAAGDTCIDQNPGGRAFDDGSIAAAAARQHRQGPSHARSIPALTVETR